MAEKTKDTLFIDMKYIILYRKLGYKEIADDVFTYDYADTTIIIKSEEQKYVYCGKEYPLLVYKDFVVLECIDRLLKKGYSSKDVIRFERGYDLSLMKDDVVYCGIYAEGWGKNYAKMIDEYSYSTDDTVCLYTSQLSGGIVDYKSEIHTKNGTFYNGIFERSTPKYNNNFWNVEEDGEYSKEFVVKKGELLKYLGNDSIVSIPYGITRIGAGAFWNNLAIEQVTIPESVTCICGDAFVYCENLKSANIPASVIEMGDDPFAGCLEIVIDNKSAEFVLKGGVLFDKSMRTLIHYSSSKQDRAYIIPLTVEWIGKHSFYKCEHLQEVTITKNVKFMGNNAFSDCRNIHIVNESSYFHYINGVLYDRSKTTCMHYSMGSGVKTVILEDTVRTIGRNCFWNCDMIEKIIIPKSVRQIGYNPFANCKNVVIENHSPYYAERDGILYDATVSELVFCPPTAAKYKIVVLPDTVINIGRSAFTGCITLTDITLPQHLKYISRGAFSGCSKLKEITIPQSVEDVADWCFNNCTALGKAYIPKHIILAPNTFEGCDAEIIRI